MYSEQRLLAGILAGFAGAAVGGGLWAIVTALTHYQIGWMAVGVDALVGVAVRLAGRGISVRFSVTGTVLALLGCLTGNLLAACMMAADQFNIPLGQILRQLTPAVALELLTVTFSPMDILFYGIALCAGYRLSFRQIAQAELVAAMQPASGSPPESSATPVTQ